MVNRGVYNNKKRIAPATQEDIMDLEKDIHSIKTLHGYTKQEHAETVERLNNTEAKMNESADLLKSIQERFNEYSQQDHAVLVGRLCKTEDELIETTKKLDAVEGRLQNLELDVVLVKRHMFEVWLQLKADIHGTNQDVSRDMDLLDGQPADLKIKIIYCNGQ